MFTIPKAFLGLAIVAMAGFHVTVALAQRSSQPDERVVAIVGDHQIQMTDLDAQIWEDLRDLQFEIHNLRREKLYQMIEKMLLEQEAQKNGQSVEEFVYAIFEDAKLSEQEIDEIYTRNERRFRTQQESETVIKGRIRRSLNRDRGEERYQSVLGDLREKAGVEIYLEETEPPRIDAIPDDDASAPEIIGRGYNAQTLQAAEEVVARVGDHQIRMAELNAQIWEDLDGLQSEVYELRREKLEEMIEKMLLEQEAQMHGQSVEEFRSAIFENAKVSEQEIDEIYTRYKHTFRGPPMSESEIKERIRQELNRRRGSERYQSLLRELREKAGVEIYLGEPEPPRMDAGLQLPVQGQNTGAREITGRVYNARTSQPIEGAELEIQVRSIIPSSPSNPMLFSSRSDSKGQFQAIIDTPGSRVRFSIKKQGYIPRIEEVVFPPTDLRLSKEFGLLPGGSLRSTVKDAVTQKLIPGASVRVFMDVPQVAGPQPGIGGYTVVADGGRFEIDGLLEAEGTAFAQSRRYAFDYRRVSIRAGEVTSVDFALQRSGTVSGVVVDANGTPLANREVSTVQLDNEVVSLISQAVSEEEVTDSDGKFTISTNLAQGKAFALEVNPVISGSAANAATEFLPTVSEPMVIAQAGGSITGVQLVMRKGVEVSIRVTDKGGNPLAGARVRLRKRLPGNPLELPSTVVSEASRVGVSSNATGTVLFQGVSSGEWLLMVGLSGYQAHRATVKVDQKNATFDVPLDVFVPSR